RHTRFSRDWSSDVCSSDLLKLEEPIVEIEDKLVGVYIQILEYNNQGDLVETLPLFGEEGYLYVIHQSEDEDQIIDIDDIMSPDRSEEHTSELQSRENLVCR